MRERAIDTPIEVSLVSAGCGEPILQYQLGPRSYK